MFGQKKITQSVAFSLEDAADQALWEAIEKELSLTKYQTFSNLCKQALWQFLFVSETPTNSPSSSPPPGSPGVRSPELDDQVSQLQKQLSHLERQIVAEEGNRFERLERQLAQMTQQLALIQLAVTTLPSSPPPQPVVQTPPPSVEPTPQPEKPQEQPTSQQESDPVLQRLSSLVDDF